MRVDIFIFRKNWVIYFGIEQIYKIIFYIFSLKKKIVDNIFISKSELLDLAYSHTLWESDLRKKISVMFVYTPS
jgi:hypothetical protein